MDQVSVKKVASLAFLLVIMLLMALPPALVSAPAPTLMKKNNNGTTVGCNNGIMEKEEGEETCRLIAHDYLDMEFMMDSGIGRMLDEQSKQNDVVYSSLIQIAPACDRKQKPGESYSCTPEGRPIKTPGRCFHLYRPPCTTP